MRFAYCYLMIDQADRVRQVAPDHAAYWLNLQFGGYEGGPSPTAPGLIVFAADSVDHAGQLVGGDPFVRHGLLADRWVKQWMA
jgi:uncharacterized protein YciI